VLSGLSITLNASANNTYIGNVTPLLRYWHNLKNNHGMILRSGSEQYGLELFYIFGSDASDESKKPYLEISYSTN